ncbi:MAG: hypothetical protein Q8L37_02675 [Candidatus Gottesmanbacteria bacterium]|nr:hypothetical protein [Candidatus Gottesmanbacteria bacterium]
MSLARTFIRRKFLTLVGLSRSCSRFLSGLQHRGSRFAGVVFILVLLVGLVGFSAPPAAHAEVGTLDLKASTASYSGTMTQAGNQPLRTAFGPLRFDYKSGPNTWTTGFLIREGDGNVSIGSNITSADFNSTSKLRVLGIVESTTGGFKFPDGTTQTSAVTAAVGGGWTDGGTDVYLTTTTDNVGIGTTTPGTKLHIQGADGATPPVLKISGLSTSGSALGGLVFSDAAGNEYSAIRQFHTSPTVGLSFDVWTGSVLTPKMVIKGDGNVGIGTSSPGLYTGGMGTNSLYVSLNDAEGSVLELARGINGDGGVPGVLAFVNPNNSSVTTNNANARVVSAIYSVLETTNVNAGLDSGGHLYFDTKPEAGATATRMVITSAGNVGIGSTAPGAKLEVAGNIDSSTGALQTAGVTRIDNSGVGTLAAGTTIGGSAVGCSGAPNSSACLKATGTGTGSTGTGSIYFLDSSGGTRGRFSTLPSDAALDTNFGTGADGAVTISTAKNINTQTINTDRSYADGIAYRVNAPADSATSVTRYSGSDTLTNGLVANDEVLLINIQGASGDSADGGNYEFMRIKNISISTVTFTTAITKSFNGTTASNQKVVIQRIPQYTNVTLSGSGSLTASAWQGLTTTPTGAAGYLTGIVAFRATGTVSVGAGTSITTTNLGFRAGPGNPALQGESYGNYGTASSNANLGGGGGGGNYGGGGGGGYAATGSSGTNGGTPGTGGTSHGLAALTTLFPGSGGGAGGNDPVASHAGAGGGAGGGIIFIAGSTVTNSGTITSNGQGGTTQNGDARAGSGGGGTGGSIFITGNTITLGTSIVTASAGSGTGSGPGTGGYGGAGSVGRVRVEYTGSLSGTTSPAASTATSISANAQAPSNTGIYGTLYLGATNTSSADLAEYYVSGDSSIAAGDVVVINQKSKVKTGKT